MTRIVVKNVAKIESINTVQRCVLIPFALFPSLQLNSDPSLVQDGVPDIFTLSFSSLKVGIVIVVFVFLFFFFFFFCIKKSPVQEFLDLPLQPSSKLKQLHLNCKIVFYFFV